MRILYTTACLMLFFVFQLKAQLTTTQTLTPQQLVQTVLLGSGVTATNITYTGDPIQIAQFFATTSTSLGIPSGIFLSTGNASTASADGPQGPNSSPATSTSFSGPGDSNLNSISSASTADAAVLEFDFIPTSDSIKFRYCFGSEEYLEYVGSFNDAFAFFLTGPDPAGGTYTNKNLALVPGTTTPVTINNVNSSSNSAYFRNNTGGIDCEFDGLTKVMYSLAKVVCGQTYHIKIAIADAGDDAVDSGVFLEGGSFSSLPPLNVYTINSNSNIPDSILVEDCNTYCAYFIRNANIANVDSFNLQVTGNAILGTDYIQTGTPGFVWPTKLIFAAGQDTIKICNINALQDNLVEGTDTIKFTMTSFATSSLSCLSTNSIRFNLYIKDYTPISIGQNNTFVCTGLSTVLNAAATGGYAPYTYTLSSPTVNTPTLNTGPINSPTNFTITVNDICNMPVTKQVTVSPVATPTVVSTSTIVCVGDTVSISASGALTYSWSTGQATQTINVSPPGTVNYTVIGAVGACTNFAVSTVTVVGLPIFITGNNNLCIGQSTSLTASGSTTYTWNTGATTSVITVTPGINTTYSVTSIAASCTNHAVYTVSVTAPPTMSITGTAFCAGQTSTITASGATSYIWNTGATTNSIVVNPSSSSTYTVIGSSIPSCTSSSVFTPSLITSSPQLLNNDPIVFCVDSVKQIPVRIVGGNPPYMINWLIPAGGITPYDTLNYIYFFTQSGTLSNETYTILVTDQCMYKDTITLNISTIDCSIIIPNVVTANGDGVNDYFKINGLQYFPGSTLNVYNRWGNRVYQSGDYKNDWMPDGTSGTYFYIVNISDGRKFNGFFQVFKD